jgi:hypothetical protein
LDTRPSAQIGREYRLTVGMLLEQSGFDPDRDADDRAHAELLALLSASVRVPG